MNYSSLENCVLDLEKHGHLIRVTEAVDPCLEMAAIQRRVYAAKGPAILFTQVKGSRFRAVSNLFGSLERTRFIFRGTLRGVQKLVDLKVDPSLFFKRPLHYAGAIGTVLNLLPRKKRGGPIFDHTCEISDLPPIQSWPKDGGAFITLPQVYSEHPNFPGWKMSNLGMYRIQLSGNQYTKNSQIGAHYQIHRSIGVHHAAAIQKSKKLRVSVFVGGPPAHTLAAVMPLPEGLTELAFAGAMAGRAFRYARRDGHVISTDADFCIVGTIDPSATLPEGPFGDHLGYYSLAHEFPFIQVEKVYHKTNAIWPFTVVGRPPQEDTSFGEIIHEITGPIIPTVIPGLHAVNAVDAAGVHPLLLAIGSERYTAYQNRKPQEILTIANAILGQGQLSLAKYLMIVAREDNPDLNIHHIDEFLIHLLERIDWRKDLHFQTETTMDTLDYSGTGLNSGSKVVMAAAGEKKRELSKTLPSEFSLPAGFGDPRIVMPGVLSIKSPRFADKSTTQTELAGLSESLSFQRINGVHLIVLSDDSTFTSASLNNFLWVTFTRSNPAVDIYGVGSFYHDKHWGCEGPLIIDARIKPHHAPPLEEDPEIERRVDALGEKGKSLFGII